MNIKYFEKKEAAVDFAAQMLFEQIKNKPNSVLGFATGSTFEPVYYDFIGKVQKPDGSGNLVVSMAGLTTYNLDEYLNIDEKNADKSYYHYMNQHVFQYTDIDLKKTNFPCHYSEDFRIGLTFPDFETALVKNGGIDFQFLGLGENAHIAFNEPGTPLESITRCVTLTPSTINANARNFASPADVPTKAVTMGLRTIKMNCRKIVLVAFGPQKANALRQLVNARAFNPNFPVTALFDHPDVTIITDIKL